MWYNVKKKNMCLGDRCRLNPSFTTYSGKLLSISEPLISVLENVDTSVYLTELL